MSHKDLDRITIVGGQHRSTQREDIFNDRPAAKGAAGRRSNSSNRYDTDLKTSRIVVDRTTARRASIDRAGRHTGRGGRVDTRDGSASDRGKRRRTMILSIICIVLACILPTFAIYTSNATEMAFVSTLAPMGISAACGVGLFLVLKLILKRSYCACLIVTTVMTLLLNFNMLTALTKTALGITASHIITIIIIVLIIVGVSLLLIKRSKEEFLRSITLVCTITFLGVILFNTFQASDVIVPKLSAAIQNISAPRESSSSEVAELPPVGAPKDGDPNLYYFILDEYASFAMLEKYYDYDNAEFRSFLEQSRFNISETSYSLSTITPLCIADVVTLNYLPEGERTTAGGRKGLRKAKLYGQLEKLGYRCYQLSTNPNMFYGVANLRDESLYEKAEAETEDGDTMEEIMKNQSIWSIFSQEKVKNDNAASFTYDILSSEETIASISGTYGKKFAAALKSRLDLFDFFTDEDVYRRGSNIAVFSYICCPHVPFVFTADGHSVNTGDHSNWTDKSFYIDQLQYVSKRMMKIVSMILENDPNSIIIIQSDHGVRNHVSDRRPNAPNILYDDARQILNVVYYKGEKLDIEGKTALNTMRLILSSEYGLDYPQVPEP